MAIGPGEDLAWERLADALIQRRIDLHYRNRRAFCDARQIDYRLIFDIEKMRRTNFARPTMLDIARAYLVMPESIDRLLHGQGDLEPPPQSVLVPVPEPESESEAPASSEGGVTIPLEAVRQLVGRPDPGGHLDQAARRGSSGRQPGRFGEGHFPV